MCGYLFDKLPLKTVIHPTKSKYIYHNSIAVWLLFEFLVKSLNTKTYPGPPSTFKMESFAAIINA